MLLPVDIEFALILTLPLLIKHSALLFSELTILVLALFARVLLPVKYSHSVADTSLFLIGFASFPFFFRLEV